MKIKKISDEVYYATEATRVFDKHFLAALADLALRNASGKCRVCLHPGPEHGQHEMLIALRQDVYYPPHRFCAGEETHFILLGTATMNLYDDNGLCTHSIPLGSLDSGRASYVRVPTAMFHSMKITSDVCVDLESKNGPFIPEDNEQANFAGI